MMVTINLVKFMTNTFWSLWDFLIWYLIITIGLIISFVIIIVINKISPSSSLFRCIAFSMSSFCHFDYHNCAHNRSSSSSSTRYPNRHHYFHAYRRQYGLLFAQFTSPHRVMEQLPPPPPLWMRRKKGKRKWERERNRKGCKYNLSDVCLLGIASCCLQKLLHI